jgi:hypothetical protein
MGSRAEKEDREASRLISAIHELEQQPEFKEEMSGEDWVY